VMGYVLLAKCDVAQRKPEEAVKLLEKAALIEPNNKNIHYQLAKIYQDLHQPAKAHEHLQIFETLYAQEREQKAKRQDELHERTGQSKD
jgi:Tfp pilus assembly protein PilF